MHLVKLVVLGAPGCGKTSLIRQFVQHEFSDYIPTKQKHLYYPTIVVEDRLYEVQIVDLPNVSFFPKDTFEEWAFYRGYGLRTCTAYILIFDVTMPDTFQLVKQLRDQIVHSRNEPLIVIAANKQDLLIDNQLQLNDHSNSNLHQCQQQTQTKSRHMSNDRPLENQKQQQQYSNGSYDLRSSLDINKEYSSIAKKQMKCPYVECSSKYNWHVTTVFREVMKLIERQFDMNQQKSSSHSIHGRRRCKIQ